MVGATIALVDERAPVKAVHAVKSKERRAGPISLLYEKGEVLHCRVMPELEDQMRAFAAQLFGQATAQPFAGADDPIGFSVKTAHA